jgi:serine/threonine protein kinase/Tfp pilus assembly protein PilF
MSSVQVSRSPLSDYVEAFEAARCQDGATALAGFLPERGDAQFTAVLAELVRVDMEYAWSDGRPKRLDDYRQVYPELFVDPAVLADVTFEEYRLRRLAGEPALPSEYRERYGVSVSRWPGEPAESPTECLPISPRQDETTGTTGEFPRIGTTFLGFRLQAELGRGAFGRVYLAQQGDLADRSVALKITRDARVETQALARLQHTNVMPIYSVHHAPPFHAVCMPYFPGLTLADLCRGFASRDTKPDSARALLETVRDKSASASSPAPPLHENARPIGNVWAAFHERSGVDAVVWIGARLADGLAHAHERGIVHRDLKPANILLTEDGQPLILDFNLADDAHTGGERAFLGGTLPYMAPEQLQSFLNGKPHGDPRSDIYALGMILFEMLANRPAYPAQTGDWRAAALATLADRNGPPPRLRSINRSVSPALEAIVRRCLEPDPNRRYGTAAELSEDLQRQFDHLPLRYAREPSLREQVAKYFQRHPGMLSATRLGVVAAVVIVTLSVGLVIRSNRLATLEARRDADKWLSDAIPTQLLELRGDVDNSTDGAIAALLGRYRVLDDPNWFHANSVSRLSGEEQNRLRNAVGELLLVRASSLRKQAPRMPAERESLFDQASRMNELAERSFPPEFVPRAVWTQRAEIAAQRGQADEARRLRDVAAAVPLRSARDYVWAARGGRKREEAGSLLNVAERLRPSDASTWCFMGLAYRDVKKYDRAISCFDMSLILNPDQPWVNEVRGETLLAAGDSARAKADFDAALAVMPEFGIALANRALARENTGDLAGALADLTAALERSPQACDLLWQRARVRTKTRDAAGAKADVTELLSRRPATARGWVARALAQRDPNAALADLDEALKLDAESETALQNRANILDERLRKPAEAIATLDELLKYHAESDDALAGRGVLMARRGDRDAALADARAALAVDRKPFTVYRVAGIYAQTSKKEPADRQDALRLLAESFRRDPSLTNLVSSDPDLDSIRKNESFIQLFAAARVLLTTAR